MSTPQVQRTVPELLGNVVDNIQQIVRFEFKLAKVELHEKVAIASKPATVLGVALLLGFYGLGFVLLAAVYGLSRVIPAGYAALIVGGVLVVVSIVLATSSVKKLKSLRPAPERTIKTFKEDVQWAKEQIK